MTHHGNKELADRRAAAAGAKASLLQGYRAAKTAAKPSRLARQAERLSLVEAREARRVERDRLTLVERTRLEAAAAAETEARKSAENMRLARIVEDEAARKAERDRRYANRKARQA
ncbi:hypothetical protein Rhsp01_63410 [Rhizobium sp. NBRC 114257]|uniref:Uncharacterized protein n=1 Tax=Rhizobium dioscoreae TaxID=2653122 RepID=A0ABQ0ZDW5_9HYPH|nr:MULTISPECIES: DUF6481 family protein [Rhizobium]GES53725.1 hypothetical protein RsS93_63390 [Rhizobium dioscoreae]GLU85165.1 hypothetical protein Rhsp01_63410 [Rhizobium sp. NBRC 114257]